ncbi:helix-turn-helix domain-containing protein [Spirosoma sp. KUDC1026]|uniref:helix-turn-helix domain-containing protein n=1 Tax=Spirosoma sp. KUDC1026 TaxID=2745947 RepID=UPI00159B9EE7|nr:helix-turn-helix transcriptional regulator [Spirosoma sp. KUDC1026]QKZ15213.1 helix-turn-helix transcriptional regulator [Spirosoma sp. KUDC1026]
MPPTKNKSAGFVQGKWLQQALESLGETQSSAALKMGRHPSFFSKHINDKMYFGAEKLSELARTFPDLNIRYVLTGEGEPLL